MKTITLLSVTTVCVCLSGCGDTAKPVAEKPADRGAKPGLKMTDDIGEFKPEDGKEIVDSKVKISNPVTGPLEAYEPLKQKLAEDIAIQQAVRMFQATEGRYPKDYDEFMTKVIRANKIRLPQLGPGKQYQYDVENHKLVVVRVDSTDK